MVMSRIGGVLQRDSARKDNTMRCECADQCHAQGPMCEERLSRHKVFYNDNIAIKDRFTRWECGNLKHYKMASPPCLVPGTSKYP